MRELEVHEVARRVRSGGRRGPVRARRRVSRPAVCPDGRHPDEPVLAAVTAQSLPVARAVRSSVPAVRAERSLRVARAEPEPGPRRGGVCARGALPGGPARPAAVWRGGPAPTPGGGASAVREGRESRVVRVVRPASRRCLVAVARRRGRSGVRPRGERLLAGAAAVLCSATVVLLLGLLGDAAAGWNAGSAVPSEGSAPVLVVDR